MSSSAAVIAPRELRATAVPQTSVVEANPLSAFYRAMAVGGAKIVFVGDSLTEGRGAAYEEGFVPRLATRLRRALDLSWTPRTSGSTYIPVIPGYPCKDRYPWTLGWRDEAEGRYP